MKKQKSFTGSLTIIMVVLLAIAFTAANFISTRYWMKVVVDESSKSMSAVRAQYGSAVIQVSLISTIMGFIVIFIILILMRKIVINPVKLCCKEIENLANFDLRENEDTKKLEQLGKFNHELGTIARSLLILKTNFTSLGSKISDTSTQLKINASGLAEKTVFVMDSSDEIEKAMDTVNRGAMDQAEDTTNGVGIVEDLSERINKTIEDTKSLSDSSDKIDSIKDEGMSVINELIRKTNETNAAVGLVKDALFKNSEQAKKIEEASKLINGIASQTNLLSLNASIEAARAGEAGRGFAVVAGEIGSLADETNKLTSEIEQIIADLLDKTNEAADNMVDMENSFKSQEESVNITKEKFNDIESAVGDIKYRVDLLSKSSEFMIESRDSLQVLMGELTSKAQSNAAAAEEVTAAVDTQTDVIQDITGISQELAAIAEELENETHQFII